MDQLEKNGMSYVTKVTRLLKNLPRKRAQRALEKAAKLAPEDIVTKHEKREKEANDQDDTNKEFKNSVMEDESEETDVLENDEADEMSDGDDEIDDNNQELEENVLQSTGAMLTKFEVFVSFRKSMELFSTSICKSNGR